MNETQNSTMSGQINELASALSKAQAEIKAAEKNCVNPYFGSKYADLGGVWDACREPLTKNGLCVIQTTAVSDGKLYLNTMLAHSSGQWILSIYPIVPVKNDPQGVGSAITYAKRYALSALVGVVSDEDDDGSEASTPPTAQKGSKAPGNAKNTASTAPSGQQYDKRGFPHGEYPPANPGWEKELCTEPQRKKLFAMAKEAGFSDEQLKEVIKSAFKKESSKDLTKGEIQALFTDLENNAKPAKR